MHDDDLEALKKESSSNLHLYIGAAVAATLVIVGLAFFLGGDSTPKYASQNESIELPVPGETVGTETGLGLPVIEPDPMVMGGDDYGHQESGHEEVGDHGVEMEHGGAASEHGHAVAEHHPVTENYGDEVPPAKAELMVEETAASHSGHGASTPAAKVEHVASASGGHHTPKAQPKPFRDEQAVKAQETTQKNTRESALQARMSHGGKTSHAQGTTSGADVPGDWFVQVGAYGNRANAQNQLEKMRKYGFPAFIVEDSARGLHRVRFGPYPSRALAAKAGHYVKSQLGVESSLVAPNH